MEDASYRASSQYRLWTLPPEKLDKIREATNSAAAAKVREAMKRNRQTKRRESAQAESANTTIPSTDSSTTKPITAATSEESSSKKKKDIDDKEIECLTPQEELMLIRYYCRKIMEIADVFGFPSNVKATAPTFLRRLFTRTSPMTYHPKDVLATILYLTTKAENHYISIEHFSEKIPKGNPEEILAPEFVVAMGLRWCFEVHHPFRGLEGGIMELMRVCNGNYTAPIPPSSSSSSSSSTDSSTPQTPPTTAKEWQKRLESLPPLSSNPLTPRQRVERAHGKARSILTSTALLTDVYFHYTPSQIFLSALHIVDPDLTLFYLDLKLPSSRKALKEKLLETIRGCAKMLREGGEPGAPISREELDKAMRIDRKLYFCRNPEKLDMVGNNKLIKRGVSEGNENRTGEGESREAKKRKLERERNAKEGEKLFGSSLVVR